MQWERVEERPAPARRGVPVAWGLPRGGGAEAEYRTEQKLGRQRSGVGLGGYGRAWEYEKKFMVFQEEKIS